jgi:hypothetical protein
MMRVPIREFIPFVVAIFLLGAWFGWAIHSGVQ